MPWWGVVSSAVAPLLLAGGWTVAAGLQPRSFNPVAGTISSLAAQGATGRQVMTLALAGVGACHVLTGLALRPAALAGRLILMAGGAATVLVAANPEPAGGGGSLPHTFWAVGPYSVARATRGDVQLVPEEGGALPEPAHAVTLRIVHDENARALRLEAGRADVAVNLVSPTLLPALASAARARRELAARREPHLRGRAGGATPRSATPASARALSLAIDRAMHLRDALRRPRPARAGPHRARALGARRRRLPCPSIPTPRARAPRRRPAPRACT